MCCASGHEISVITAHGTAAEVDRLEHIKLDMLSRGVLLSVLRSAAN